jgi:hypothetical protein
MRIKLERLRAWPLTAVLAVLPLSVAAGEDGIHVSSAASHSGEALVAEAAPGPERPSPAPPATSPGAAPSTDRIIGTWTVTEFKGSPADGGGDLAASTTYRFQDAGRVTVAGTKQCAYTFEEMALKVDCAGRIVDGKIEFRGAQTMAWTIGAEQVVTFTKR